MASDEWGQLDKEERKQRAIRRREKPVGLIDDVDRAGGTALWDMPEPRSGYVQGRWSDDGPLAALFRCEIRRAYQVLLIAPRDAVVFDLWLDGVSKRGIADMLGMPETTVRRRINNVFESLDGVEDVIGAVSSALNTYDDLGRITVTVEGCGGWRVVAGLLR